jgi:predicted aspartyl protease
MAYRREERMNKSGWIATLLCSAGFCQAAPEACGLASAPATQFLVQVPFDVVDGRVFVQAQVNGRGPFRFAVDTGASGWGRADGKLVTALGLQPDGATTTSDGVRNAQVRTVRLDKIALGGLARDQVDVITRDYGARAGFDGILGRRFFEDGLLILDYPHKRLSFTRSASLQAEGEGILAYQRAFRVPVSIGAVATEANIDTGANVSFVVPQALYDQVGDGKLAPAAAGTLTNSKIETSRAVLAGPIRIGAVILSQVDVRVSKQYPELLLGAHALQDFVVMIDQRSQRIALCR